MNYISNSAKIGNDLVIGYFSVIEENVTIGDGVIIGNNTTIIQGTVIEDNVRIGNNCVIGKVPRRSKTSSLPETEQVNPLLVKNGCNIGESVIIYAGAILGLNCFVGDIATIREGCSLGDLVVVGRGVAIENNCSIGSLTKIQTGAYITAYTNIGEQVFIAPMVTTTNDNFMGRTERAIKEMKGPNIYRGARIGGNAIILPSITIGEESFVAAGSVVTKDIIAGKQVKGVPAKVYKEIPDEEKIY